MIKPLGDRVVVRADKAMEVSKGGIYLPEATKEKPSEGVVLAIGTGRISGETGELVPLVVKVGDKVLFAKFAGVPVIVDDEELLIMREEEIFAVAA